MFKIKKPFALWNKKRKKFIEFFEYPIQAKSFIEKRLGGSKYIKIIDLRKKKKR